MSDTIDFILRSRRVLTPQGLREAAVAVAGGRVAAVLNAGEVPAGRACVELGRKVLMPGLVDCHVHVNEPGRADWEGFETAGRAAAAGGITALADMPLNSVPPTTSARALELKRRSAKGRVRVDCGFWGGLVPENRRALEPLLDAGALGVKAFLIDSGVEEFPAVSEWDLREAMPVLARRGVPLLVHAELDGEGPGSAAGSARSYASYLASRPRDWENRAVKLLAGLCRETGCRVHVVHLSSCEALETVAAAKREGLPLSAETCPHYLYFGAEDIPDGATAFKCAPPIRERENRERLWEGLGSGVLDFIVSDHSPCLPELKGLGEGDFMKAWGGVASLQLSLPAVWTQASRRGFGLEALAEWMCERPARFAGFSRKGRIEPGRDADFVVFDPEEAFAVEPGSLQHRHGLTPYAGRYLQGVVEATYVRGRKVYERGKFPGEPCGELLERARDDHGA